MIIGLVRPEEAKVFDAHEGYHQFHNEHGEASGSFEVFWNEGWYWWPCFPGCLPCGEPNGPFSTSYRARTDADEYCPD